MRCVVCGHEKFEQRRSLLNTAGLTFLGLEWANRQALNLVCRNCGHLMWFVD